MSALSGFGQDARYGLRQARRNPGLAVIVVASLALGIGANTAIFSLIEAALLREVPVAEPGRVLALQWAQPEGGLPDEVQRNHSGRGSRDRSNRPVNISISWPSFVYIRSRVESFSSFAGYVPLGMFDRPAALVGGQPMFIDGEMVTSGYFPALGVSPTLGRAIVADDEQPGRPRVGVISHGFWERAFGSSPSVLGETISINGVPVTIVGVGPAGFSGVETGRSCDIWIQMGPQPGLTPWGGRVEGDPQAVFAEPTRWWLQTFGRLTPGVGVEQAGVEMERLLREAVVAHLDGPLPADKLPSAALTPISEAFNFIRRRFSTPLTVLMTGVGLVLLIACANVATLLLAKASSRRKEMSLRLATGASRSRLVRQLLTESLLYAAAGAAGGLVLAGWGSDVLLVLLSQRGQAVPIDVRLDLPVLSFTAGISILTTILFGLAPALRATRVDLASDLKENAATGRGETGAMRLGGGKLLVVAQVAMALPLLVGAGLFMRTVGNLEGQRLGFDPDGILLFNVDPTKAGFEGENLLRAYSDIRDGIGVLPGVRSVSASRLGLITGWVSNGSITIEGEPANADTHTQHVHWNQVTPGFFETMGMDLLLGRPIDERDTEPAPHVAVVNEAMAKMFAGQNPVGRRFYFGRTPEPGSKPIEIIGVVRDAKYSSLRDTAPPTAYVPHAQSRVPLSGMVFQVRAAGDPMALVGGVRQVVGRVVPGVPIGDVKTQARQIDDSLGQETMYARLFGFFGAGGLLLASIGLYGTMAYALGRRTREIGIRMALGAARGSVMRMALVESLVVAAAGVAAGGLLAFAVTRYLQSLLFEVTPLDPPAVAFAVVSMFGVALVAGYLPARRASRLDPLRALREE